MATKRKAPKGCIWHKGNLWGAAMVNGVRVRWPLETDNPKIASQRRQASLDNAVARRFEKLGSAHRIAKAAAADGARTYADEALPHHLDSRAVGAKTRQRYYCSLDQIDEFLSGKRLTEIDGALIGEIIKGRRARGVTSATIKRDLVALSAVMNAAIAEGWIDANPVLPRLKNIKEKRDPIVLPDRAHIDLVMERAPGMIRELIDAAARTGAREDELLKLRRGDIDHDRKQMTVRRIDEGGPKGGKTRVVDLTPFGGYDHLRSLPAYAKSDLVFWHSDGEDYKTTTIRSLPVRPGASRRRRQHMRCASSMAASSIAFRALNWCWGISARPSRFSPGASSMASISVRTAAARRSA
jgi:integrase/recombinase XerD